jgi:hypothetical protein
MDQKTKPVGKKLNPIVIVVVAIIVIGALYYGTTRWRQQQYINQLAKMYGGNAGLLGNLTGGNNGLTQDMLKKIAEESAKEETQQKVDDAKEAAKTPLDRFNETKEVALTANVSSVVKSVIETQMLAVFVKIKPTLVSGNYMKQGDSFLVVYKVPRQPTSEDMNKLVEELTKSGYTAGMNTVEAESAQIIMDKNGNSVSIGYENPTNQEVTVLYVDESANN